LTVKATIIEPESAGDKKNIDAMKIYNPNYQPKRTK
jgi:hypothetical protein